MFNKKDERGLLLVEIIVVVLIIAFIGSVIVIGMDVSKKRAKDAAIRSDLEQIQVIAETTYNPQMQYKELYNMRESGHIVLKRIEEKILEMDRDFDFFFPQDSVRPEVSGYSQYCAYVYLFMNTDELFCVDYRGTAKVVDVSDGKRINCEDKNYYPYDCDYQ